MNHESHIISHLQNYIVDCSLLFHSRPFWICRSSQIHLLNHSLQRCFRLEDNTFFPWSKYSLVFPCWAVSGPCDDFWVLHQRPEHVTLLIGELLVWWDSLSVLY